MQGLGFFCCFVLKPYKNTKEAQGGVLRALRDGGTAGVGEGARSSITAVLKVYTLSLRIRESFQLGLVQGLGILTQEGHLREIKFHENNCRVCEGGA